MARLILKGTPASEMTIRDEFAKAAMQGMVTYAATQKEVDAIEARSGMPYSQFIVKSAAHYADELIAELNKNPQLTRRTP